MAHIVNVKVIDGFRLQLTFKNQVRKVVNLESILSGPVFGPLRDLAKFRQVRVDHDFGGLEWPNGADICPDALYDGHLQQWVENFSPNERKKLNNLSARYRKASKVEKKKILVVMGSILRRTKPYQKQEVISI